MKFTLSKKKMSAAGMPGAHGSMLHRLGRDHYFDWGLMLGVSFVVALTFAAIGAYAYMNIETRLESASTLDSARAPETLDEQKLQSIMERFDARAAERAVLLKGYGGFGDPSL